MFVIAAISKTLVISKLLFPFPFFTLIFTLLYILLLTVMYNFYFITLFLKLNTHMDQKIKSECINNENSLTLPYLAFRYLILFPKDKDVIFFQRFLSKYIFVLRYVPIFLLSLLNSNIVYMVLYLTIFKLLP